MTGGAAGIAAAISRRLDEAGAEVIIVDVDAKEAERVASELARGRAVGGDVRARTTAQYPSVPMLDLAEPQWDEIVDVNLKGTFLFSQAAAPLIAQSGGGSIVNISSRAGLRARPGVVAYSAAKAGVVALTQGLAMELAHLGIRVNAVAPGPVATARAGVAAHAKVAGTDEKPEDWQANYRARIPLRRFADLDEIAVAVLFLASPAASCITGAVLAVDGGALLP